MSQQCENTQPVARSFHLHLQIPAVGLLAHVEPLERITTNGTKWGHVRVTNPVEQSQNQSGESSGEDLLEIHAARFALSAGSRADHEIVRPACHGFDKLIHERGYVAAVAIEKNHNVAFGRKHTNAGGASASVSARRGYHARTCFMCAQGSSIRTAVINDNDLVRQTCRETFTHDGGDWFLLIKRGDNDGNEHEDVREADNPVCQVTLADKIACVMLLIAKPPTRW